LLLREKWPQIERKWVIDLLASCIFIL